MRPTVGDVTVYLEFPGRTEATARVEIRARVRGFLKSREFVPGTRVNEGDLLFTIEPEEFTAAKVAAEGSLAQAEANRELARSNLMRREQTRPGAVSEVEILAARADVDQAEAAVSIAQSALDNAIRNLSYTEIRSPLAGRVSRDFVTAGNLVGAAEPTLLTTVVRDDEVYVNFEVNERAILPFLNQRPGAPQEKSQGSRPIRMRLTDRSLFPGEGVLDFIDNEIDPATGTVRARAVFANPDGTLASGIFVMALIPETIAGAVQVPRLAIQRDLGGSFVLTVDPDGRVVRRPVVPSEHILGDTRIVSSGLTGDEPVIVSNLQRAREGIIVRPVERATGDAPPPDAAPEGTGTGAEPGSAAE
jgi:multidrug efflux system membrane fusion protein